jgi:hypothetical protein
MECNVGIPDKLIRISLALLIAGLLFIGIIPESMALIALVPAGVFLITGIFSYCPLYTAFGIKSR